MLANLRIRLRMPASHPLPDSSNEACAICARDRHCNVCFDELVARLQVPLLHYIMQRTRNRQDAEDVLQETFLLGYRNIAKYDAAWRFTTWIFTIAHRQAISAARKAECKFPRSSEPPNETADAGHGPFASAVESEARESLWAGAKDILDSDAFTAVWLTYVQGMSADEVGEVIGRNANAVRILLTRSRARLAERLPEHCRPERTNV